MTKSTIINQVAKELGTTATKAKPLVEAVFEDPQRNAGKRRGGSDYESESG